MNAVNSGLRNRRASRKKIVFRVVHYAALAVIVVILLFPYVFMVNKSLMDIVDINSVPVRFFPSALHFENYGIVYQYFAYIGNTLVVCLINGFFIPLTGCLVAFPLARYQFVGKKIFFAILMSTVMIPGAITQIPVYVMYSRLGLVNKVASQWVGAFFGGSAMSIFLIVQFIRGIPKEMDNAAYIDGANKLHILFMLVLPLCRNVFIYTAVTTVMGKWSDFQGPLIYITAKEKYTMAVAFYYEFFTDDLSVLFSHRAMAMAAFMTLVPMALFFCFQKMMIGGVKMGALKG